MTLDNLAHTDRNYTPLRPFLTCVSVGCLICGHWCNWALLVLDLIWIHEDLTFSKTEPTIFQYGTITLDMLYKGCILARNWIRMRKGVILPGRESTEGSQRKYIGVQNLPDCASLWIFLLVGPLYSWFTSFASTSRLMICTFLHLMIPIDALKICAFHNLQFHHSSFWFERLRLWIVPWETHVMTKYILQSKMRLNNKIPRFL